MNFQIVLLGLLAALIVQVLFFLYNVLTSSLRDVPGPLAARLTKWWYFDRVRRGHFEQDDIALHKKHGRVVRIAPDHYSFDDPSVMKTIYGIASRFPKSEWYEGWKHPDPERFTLFPDRNMKRHAETRKLFQAMYSMTSLVSYEPYVDECADVFETRLTEFAKTQQEFDMGHWFQCYAFDVIGDITFGERFGFLERGEDLGGILAALQNSMVYCTLIGIFAKWHPILFGPMTRLAWSGASDRNFIINFVKGIINKRRTDKINAEEGTGPETFLDKMLRAHHEEPEKVTDYHIFMMGQSNVIAGSDTTAISLSAIIYHLLRNPATMQRLREEIAQAQSDGRSIAKTTFKESQQMPYLQAVVKEGLRMHTATGLPLWREVPEGGAELSGYYFPSGTVVGVNTWVAHYNEDVFPQATEFRPERWLESEQDPARLKAMDAYYMPFGLGSRTCLGMHISILEMSKLIPRLVSKFDFELLRPEWETKNFWFVKPRGFNLRVKLREGAEA